MDFEEAFRLAGIKTSIGRNHPSEELRSISDRDAHPEAKAELDLTGLFPDRWSKHGRIGRGPRSADRHRA